MGNEKQTEREWWCTSFPERSPLCVVHGVCSVHGLPLSLEVSAESMQRHTFFQRLRMTSTSEFFQSYTRMVLPFVTWVGPGDSRFWPEPWVLPAPDVRVSCFTGTRLRAAGRVPARSCGVEGRGAALAGEKAEKSNRIISLGCYSALCFCSSKHWPWKKYNIQLCPWVVKFWSVTKLTLDRVLRIPETKEHILYIKNIKINSLNQ